MSSRDLNQQGYPQNQHKSSFQNKFQNQNHPQEEEE